jgi:hypothetical protein
MAPTLCSVRCHMQLYGAQHCSLLYSQTATESRRTIATAALACGRATRLCRMICDRWQHPAHQPSAWCQTPPGWSDVEVGDDYGDWGLQVQECKAAAALQCRILNMIMPGLPCMLPCCRYPSEADAQAVRVAVLLDELDFPGMGQPDPRVGHIVVELKTANAVPLLRYSCSNRIIGLPTAQLNARRYEYMLLTDSTACYPPCWAFAELQSSR